MANRIDLGLHIISFNSFKHEKIRVGLSLLTWGWKLGRPSAAASLLKAMQEAWNKEKARNL